MAPGTHLRSCTLIAMPTDPGPPSAVAFPPVMRRGVRWLLGLTGFFALAAVAWVVLRKPLGVPRGFAYRFGALVLVALPFVVVWPWWILRTRHIRRTLLRSDGRLCTHCAYDVSTLGDAGTCPECGGAYDREKDRVLWEAVGVRYGEEGEGDR